VPREPLSVRFDVFAARARHLTHMLSTNASTVRVCQRMQDLADVVVPPEEVEAVGFVERLRAMNALAKVGMAARAEHSAAAIKAAANAFRSGAAFRGTAYAEDVSMFVPSSVSAAGAAETN
jgi:hypothetical protein